MSLNENLLKLNLKLPKVTHPGGNYLSLNIRGNIAYVAIQFPILNGEYLYQGRLGNEITTAQGYEAMQLCALNVIAHTESKIGYKQIIGLNHFDAYFQASDSWDDSPTIVNGASDIFVQLLGEKGNHTRAIFGVDKLPRNFCVGVTASFTVKSVE
ncbi:RidA family protein [Aequorivita sp. SDUM287046]|uniref:RidA family protein n=1 Tax=Aequorivita aurantiaca TaxID=3053356 RepID=A0ABT8DMX5_9FLAO|nr:RidA family protein [Aequorivita aurantiaca]MDN3725331.1 RidA family protein [Aequorivita aurantiaca]